MSTLFRQLLPPLLGVALFEFALYGLSTLVMMLLSRQGLEEQYLGFIGASYFFGFLIGSQFGHRLIDRVGHVRAFCILTIIISNATLLHLFSDHPLYWTLLRMVIGYGIAGLFIIVESWLNDKTDSSRRARVLSIYVAVTWLAGGLGPLIINIPAADPSLYFVLITLLFSLAAIPLALTKVHHPELGERRHLSLAKLFKVSPLGISSCFASGLLTGANFSLLPVYSESRGFTEWELSTFMVVATVAGFFVQYPVGIAADRFGRRPIMLATALTAVALSLSHLLLFPEASFASLLPYIFAISLLMSPFYALGVAQTCDYVERQDFIAASSGLLFVWALGSILGPATAGFLMGRFGANGLFLFIHLVFVIMAAVIVLRMLRRPALSPKEQGHYIVTAVTSASQGGIELDPRGGPQQAELTLRPIREE